MADSRVSSGSRDPDIAIRQAQLRAHNGNVMARDTFLEAVALAVGMELKVPPAAAEAVGDRVDRSPSLRQDHLILVAEDNKVNQVVIVHQLRALGYPADVVPDGRQALERFESGDYAMIVTDLQMPEMDGYELAAAIRRVERGEGRAPIPIVALSANVLRDEALRCRAAGMNDYLAKPAGLAEIKAVLDRWLPADPDQETELAL